MFVGGGDISTCTQQQPPRLFSLGPESVRGRPKNTGVRLAFCSSERADPVTVVAAAVAQLG